MFTKSSLLILLALASTCCGMQRTKGLFSFSCYIFATATSMVYVSKKLYEEDKKAKALAQFHTACAVASKKIVQQQQGNPQSRH